MTWLRRLLLGQPHPIVGAWYVDAVAPYRPHLVTFVETEPGRGVLIFSNPTNVQDGPNASIKVTDSTGHGHWRVARGLVVGTMWQENALQPARTRGPRLAVTFKLNVQARVYGSREFSGPGIAELLDLDGELIEPAQPTYLTGRRLDVRERTLSQVPRS
jgi:hypothetical protein